ncbi:hypothetical protein HYALB_00005003 [Hymenoscyphus albidus]|uniref:Uncharacterized protein n=1 Tax=Hymenoscyphus albidus TaxID=595503 RepID=A0A9N9LQN5_9HELO|nr:hypothetical protein HYALB_00005003 [Hymenoscyphus albidus]
MYPQEYVQQTLQASEATPTTHHHHYTDYQGAPNVQPTMKSIYLGCRHELDLSVSLGALSVDGNENIHIDNSRPGVSILIHPRWCPNCLLHRQQAIQENFSRRWTIPPPADREQARIQQKNADFARGVMDGRILALSEPIVDHPDLLLTEQQNAERLNAKIEQKLVNMFAASSLAPFDEGWTPQMRDMVQFSQSDKHFKKGIKEGVEIQLDFEKSVLEANTEGEREMRLGNALY